MQGISKAKYIELRKKGINYMEDPIHSQRMKQQLDETWNDLKDFLKRPEEEIRDWQLKRIRYLVDYAFENIPLYREKYKKIGYEKGSIKTWEDFYKLPFLTKEELIEGFPDKIVKNVDDFMLSTRSSGSSGKFVTIAVSEEAIYKDTLQTIRQFYMQSGGNYNSNDKILFIYTCPWWVDNVGGEYIQHFLPTTTNVEDAVSKIKELRPRYISTYPTYLEKISSTGIKLSDYGVELVVIHSEQSNKIQRELLAKELDVQVLDEYSSEELTRIALECPHHHYHLEEDACFIEIVDENLNKLPDDQIGIVVGTNLLNTATPIIRYVQGDIAKITKEKNCECGSNARIIEGVKGRRMDCIVTNTGDKIPASCFMDIAYNWFLKYELPVHGLRYQFVQRKENELEIHLIEGKYQLDNEVIKDSMYELIPKDMDVKIFVDNQLPFEGQTKYRPVINLF